MIFYPPNTVKKEAKLSLLLKRKGFSGGTNTGIRRAISLAYGTIDIKNLLIMRNWFARHLYISRPGYLLWKKIGQPDNIKLRNKIKGAISWLLWGGDAGYNWVRSKTDILSKIYNKNYSLPKIKI